MFWLLFWLVVGPFIILAWIAKIVLWDIPWLLWRAHYEYKQRR